MPQTNRAYIINKSRYPYYQSLSTNKKQELLLAHEALQHIYHQHSDQEMFSANAVDLKVQKALEVIFKNYIITNQSKSNFFNDFDRDVINDVQNILSCVKKSYFNIVADIRGLDLKTVNIKNV